MLNNKNRGFKITTLILLISIILILIYNNICLADGIYIPEKVYEKLPTIPTQRAIISYHNGKETLIIESSLNGKGKDFGWIIPLPSAPDKIDKMSKGIFKTMPFLIQPRIIHDLSRWFSLPITILVIVLLGVICFVSLKKGGLIEFILYLLLVGFLSSMLLSAVVKARGRPQGIRLEIEHEKVEILEQVKAGIYEVTILKAKETTDLYNWLDRNGFRVPDKGKEVITDYIKKDWCFAAAKISRDLSEGISTPHPVGMEFKTSEPFYPLRLTALTESDVKLDVFVIAEDEAISKSLKKDFCDIFNPELYKEYFREEMMVYRGEKTKAIIGHPAILKLMWPGCVLTKLENRLKPKMMKKDIFLKFKDAIPYQKILFSHKGALYGAKLAILYVVIIGLIATFVYFKIRYKYGMGLYLKKMVIPVLGVAILCGGVFNVSVRKTEVRTFRDIPFYYPTYMVKFYIISDILYKGYNTKKLSLDSVREITKELLEKENKINKQNPLLGGETIEEDSPGNYVVREEEDRFIIDVYDDHGSINSIEIIKNDNVAITIK